MAHKLSFNRKQIRSDPPTTVSNTGLETYLTGNSTSPVIHVAISQFVGTLTTHHLACMSGKGILGMEEMLGVREKGGTSLRSARISIVPMPCHAG